MSALNLKRGTAVIWTRQEESLELAKMALGIVQVLEDSGRLTIEVVEPDKDETLIVTVPVEQVRPF